MRSLLAALTLITGCHLVSGLDSFQPRDDGAGAGGIAGAGGMAHGGGGAGGGLPPMVNEGLVARYFLNEPAGTTQVVDSARNPLNLVVARDASGDPDFVGEPGVRGAQWSAESEPGKISVLSSGTKLEAALHGKTAATIETVLSIDAVDLDNTRLVHFGAGSDSGNFSLRADDVDKPVFYLGGERRIGWDVSLAGPRIVLHVVFDSSRPELERASLFMNGELSSPIEIMAIGENDAIDISGLQVEFHIGNRPGPDGRSPAGIIHYVALYDIALTATQLAMNAERLAISDDP